MPETADLWQPWLGNWIVSERSGPQVTLNIQHRDNTGLTGTWGTLPLTNVWLMRMNDFDRSVLSAVVPIEGEPMSIFLCMQSSFYSGIWGAAQTGSRTHGLLIGSRSPTSG
jgi:hypothetical protein